uniref:hypothetical protein n=1 Tax=Candidatus Entotheonella palauensis TaxID=93172 RepID=UPI001C4E0157
GYTTRVSKPGFFSWITVGIIEIQQPAYRDLLEYVRDSRSDVCKVGTEALLQHLKASSEARRLFVDDAVTDSISPHLLRQALKVKIPFDASELERLRTLLSSQNPRLRYAALGLLDGFYLSAEDIENYVRLLTQDADLEIREVAYRLLN